MVSQIREPPKKAQIVSRNRLLDVHYRGKRLLVRDIVMFEKSLVREFGISQYLQLLVLNVIVYVASWSITNNLF